MTDKEKIERYEEALRAIYQIRCSTEIANIIRSTGIVLSIQRNLGIKSIPN